MIVFKRYGKTVKISNRHWKSLRARFNPNKAETYFDNFQILKDCLLCKEHEACDRCGFGEFAVGEIVGCINFFRLLFKGKSVLITENLDKVMWKRRNNALAVEQLNRIQKLMDKIEGEQE